MRDGTPPNGRKQLFAGYVRVSRVGERDERLRSPDFQERGIRAKAQAAGVEVELFPAELDVSGSKRARAVLDAIVERIEAGELAGVIVYNVSRLSRLAPKDRIELVERIENAGGTILSASEAFDASTPAGRFQRNLFFEVARLEWETKAEGFAIAKENAIAAGRPIKAVIPFGYRQPARGAELVVERDEARIVVELFELRATGASLGACLELFEARTGRRSYRSTMRSLFANRTYLGELHYGRGTRLVNAGAHDAIVGVELFEAVEAVNAERADRSRTHDGRAKALLAGIARCESCGRGLVCTRTGSARTPSYKCPSDARRCQARAHIAAADLDAYVTAEVVEWAGPVVDELVAVEVELGARGDRVVAEHRLEQARQVAAAYETNVDLELEVGSVAYAAGRKARQELVELRQRELAALGAQSEVEVVRGTLRQALTTDALDVAERRRLFRVAVAEVVVRRTPRRGAPVVERAAVRFRDGRQPETSPEREDRAELVDELAL